MARSPTDSAPPSGHHGLYKEVVRGLDAWVTEYEIGTQTTVKQNLRSFIRQYLRTTSYRRFADTVSIPKRTANCDIIIDDSIGIKLVHDLNSGSKEWMHKQLRSIFQNFDYLIVYGHQIAQKHLDTWYQIKRTLNRFSSEQNTIHALQTIQQIEYRIPLTNKTIRKAVVHHSIIYLIFIAFVLVSGQLLAFTDGADIMAQSYVGALSVFNIFVILIGAFLVRTL